MSEATDRTHVLDASALLAMLHGEPGTDAVEAVIEQAAISSVNWSEVHQRSLARGVDVTGLRADAEALGLRIAQFSVEDAEQAAELWPATRSGGLSLADRACLALARRFAVPVLTSDRSWLELSVDVEVQAIR